MNQLDDFDPAKEARMESLNELLNEVDGCFQGGPEKVLILILFAVPLLIFFLVDHLFSSES